MEFPFSEQERNRIDAFYKNEFADMSADDIALYTKWIQWKTANETESKMQLDTELQKCKAETAYYEEQRKLAELEYENRRKELYAKWAKMAGE